MLPDSKAGQLTAAERLRQLEADSQKVLQAYYADAISVHELRAEQSRIASGRAAAQSAMNSLDLNEQLISRHLENCLQLLSSAKAHYENADDTARRELNQSLFEHLYVDDDEVIASDLQPAFRRLMSDSLSADLESERKPDQIDHVRTKNLWLVPGVEDKPLRGAQTASNDLPAQPRRIAPESRIGSILGRERPSGALPWEKRTTAPERTVVLVSNFW